MATPLQDKKILLGVTGSIACYKAADLASKLSQAGAIVDVILTPAALQFVTKLTFQSVTGRRAYVDEDLWGSEGHVQHIGLGHKADLIVIAPATANTIAKLAHGLADNLLTVTALAAGCPLIVAPAMDGHMFMHKATQHNLDLLHERGAVIIGPAEGHLASGQTGIGRMIEPVEIAGHIRKVLGKSGPLREWKVVITAGGTAEPIDPVRTISNRSSGKQGYALAQAAVDAGAEVILISGPTNLETPVGVMKINIQTARELMEQVIQNQPYTDILIMAAAVADFRPANPFEQKIKKNEGPPTIALETNPDILASVSKLRTELNNPEIVVGFAAETQDLLANAQAKLFSKKLDLIAANNVQANDAGFSVDNNRVTLIDGSGNIDQISLMSKMEVSQRVIEKVVSLIQERPVVHICMKEDWDKALEIGCYSPASLNLEGFIHLSRPQQVLAVANTFFTNLTNPILLWIDPRKLKETIRWERVDNQLFPHLYGPLNIDAVIKINNLVPDQDHIYRTLPQG